MDNTENNTIESTETIIENETEQQLEGGEELEASGLEAAAEERDPEGEQIEAEVEKDKTPAWMDFTAALEAHAKALGLSIKEQKGYTQYRNEETGHKLYVAKGARDVKRVDTTLPILGQDGTYDLEKPNGKIACHVVADVQVVTQVLTQLADSSLGKLRPAKRSSKAKVETPAEEAAQSE